MSEKTDLPSDKPTGAKVGWRLRGIQRPVTEKNLTLRQDEVHVEERGEITYTYVEKAPAVLIVPITREGHIVLIRQYRYPVDDWCLETPAGGTHDTGNTSLEEVARKELAEEIGATCTHLEFVTHFYAEPSLSDERCNVYLAHDVELSLEPHTEATEEIERVLVSVAEALELAEKGAMKSGPCTLALFLCQGIFRRLGYLKSSK